MATLAAAMTGLTGVGRIDQNDRHASGQRLVGNELPQLIERPAFLAIAALLAAPGALANAGQVFEGNGSPGPQGKIHDAAAGDMVDVDGMFPFAARQPFQEAACPLRAFRLSGTPYFGVMRAEPVYLRGFMDIAIRIDRNAPLTQIHTKDLGGLDRLGRLALDLDVKEVRAHRGA